MVEELALNPRKGVMDRSGGSEKVKRPFHRRAGRVEEGLRGPGRGRKGRGGGSGI